MTETVFSALNLTDEMAKAIQEMGFVNATPIQADSIPLIRTGVDVIAKSQTGTGKTVAFGIPALEAIQKDAEGKGARVLILCPTRELAQQAGEQLGKLARYLPHVKIVEVFGGADMERQIIRLRRANVVIGTPGRVMDHLRRGTMKLDKLQMIVLDEADEMLKMGFKEDIETILTHATVEHQTVLFSATMPPAILALTKEFQNNPQMVEIDSGKVTTTHIKQSFVEVPMPRKMDSLGALLHYHQPNRTLVFCNTKRMVDELTEYLQTHGHAAESIHGDLKQTQRTAVMNAFKGGRVSILVATDVAARGIDVSDIDYVFNYDIPMKTEEYVHRIGRTGRAGKSGCAITLCTGRRQVVQMGRLSHLVKSVIEREHLPTLDTLKEKMADRQLEEVRSALGGEYTDYRIMVDTLMAEGFTEGDIATTLMALHFPVENIAHLSIPTSGKGERAPTLKPAKGDRNVTFADIVIDVGSENGVTPGHLVGAISEYGGISGKLIGKIKIHPLYCVVGVPADEIDHIVEDMAGRKICGRRTTTTKLSEDHRSRKSAGFAKDRNAKFNNSRKGGPTRRKDKA